MDLIFVFLLSFKILFFIAIMKFLYTNIPFVPPIFTTYVEDFYLRRYPELRTPFENKGKELYKYFYKTGIKEGQGASPAFDVKYYLKNNNDLKNVLGVIIIQLHMNILWNMGNMKVGIYRLFSI